MWIVYALLAAILWGLNCSLCEKILGQVSSVFLLALQMVAGSLIFVCLAYGTTWKKDWHSVISQPTVRWIVMADVLVVLASGFCIMESIRTKNATSTGLVELIYPLFTILFSWLLFRQNHINVSVFLGGIFIFIGVGLISR